MVEESSASANAELEAKTKMIEELKQQLTENQQNQQELKTEFESVKAAKLKAEEEKNNLNTEKMASQAEIERLTKLGSDLQAQMQAGKLQQEQLKSLENTQGSSGDKGLAAQLQSQI